MTDNTYAAGWYPDASQPGTERYYDGTTWTTQTRPLGAPATSAVTVAEPVTKRPWYKRKPFIITASIIGGLIVLSSIINAINGPSDAPVADTKPAATQVKEDKPEEAAVDTTRAVPNVVGMTVAEARAALVAAGFTMNILTNPNGDPASIVEVQTQVGMQEKGTAIDVTTTPPKPTYTLAQENAIDSAKSYLSFGGFSRAGLTRQLTSEYGEGFTPEDAEFAIATLEQTGQVDWNAEAADSAKSYLSSGSFSRDGLYQQLTSEYGEGFTPDQANAGLAAVGY
jgi:hypothetical protein